MQYLYSQQQKHIKFQDTVLSRCTKVSYYKASKEEIIHSLNKAVKGESLLIDKDSLTAIAERVDGSFRDGMKTLEQLVSQFGKEISLEQVNQLTGFSDDYEVESFIQALRDKHVEQGLSVLSNKDNLGIDWNVYAKRLVEELRNKMIAKPHPVLADLLARVSQASLEVKTAYIAQMPLEILLVQWSMSSKDVSGISGGGSKEQPAISHKI